jgi:hypothetical protein
VVLRVALNHLGWSGRHVPGSSIHRSRSISFTGQPGASCPARRIADVEYRRLCVMADAVDALPVEFGLPMQNVPITVEEESDGRSLWVLYRHPLNKARLPSVACAS